MDYSCANVYGGVFPLYKVYFFDTVTGKRVNYEQYLRAIGISDTQICQAIDASGVLGTTDYSVLWAAVDATQTYVMIESMDVLDGEILISLDKGILN